MSVSSRNSLPAEFLDLTSEKMLVQPEPAYAYARMVFAAWAQAELKASDVKPGVAPGRDLAPHGAGVPSMEDMQLFIGDPIRGEAIMVDTRLLPGGEACLGHTVRFNRPLFSGGGYTEANRTIDSSTAISTTGVSAGMEQVSITVKLVAGPYDTTNSRVAPYAIFGFDAQRSVHDQAAYHGLQLARDRMKYLDSVIAALYMQGANSIFPGDPTNALSGVDTAFATAGDRPLDVETLWRAEEKLRTLSIPTFGNGRYQCIIHPTQARQLRADPEFGKNAVFMSDVNVLKNSYVATLGAVDVMISATNPTGTNSSSVAYNKGTMFGPQAVGYLPGWQCHVRSANEDNFGLTPKVIWAAAEGASVLDNRFIVNLLSD